MKISVRTSSTRAMHYLCVYGLAIVTAGCDNHTAKANSSLAQTIGENFSQDSSSSQQFSTDEWLGRWNGPEGTFLYISRNHNGYILVIQNLDGPRQFDGQSYADEIVFERDGVKETIRATSGKGTGMKWLSEKHTCLSIKLGEGYCRN